MRTHSPFVVDVRELLQAHGIRKPLELEEPLEGLDVALVRVTDPIRADLLLESIDGGILVRGTVDGAYEATCRRCAAPVKQPFSVKASELYRPASEVWEEGYVIRDETIDLERMLRDAVALSLPLNPVCREDCKGLCSRCGADLNEGECDCPEETDIRWSALRELGNKLNG